MISTVLTQSSQSTNVSELEETLLQGMEIGNFRKKTESERSYCLRSRTRRKQSDELQQTRKSSRRGKNRTGNAIADGVGEFGCDDMGENSQESVSMLQDRYEKKPKAFPELLETCLNPELQEISIYEDEDAEKSDERVSGESTSGCPIEKIESSTQTDYSSSLGESSQEREMAKHAKFINSVVRLKAALSSGKAVSDKNLRDIVREQEEGMEVDSEPFYQSIPKETICYILRSSDVENVFCETVNVLLEHLDKTFREDFAKVACCWRNSVYEMTVEMLIQAVDSEAGVARMVDRFLYRTIESILNNEGKSKNVTLESKANLLISFCQSTHLSCSAINFIIEKLKVLYVIERRGGCLTVREKLSWTNLTKNTYYLLRILESCLELLKAKIDAGEIQSTVRKVESKYYNVLEMWKKHWNRGEMLEQKSSHELEGMVSGWCGELDEILLHCVNHVPVLSMAVGRCTETAKKILRTCHPDIMNGKTKTGSRVENRVDI